MRYAWASCILAAEYEARMGFVYPCTLDRMQRKQSMRYAWALCILAAEYEVRMGFVYPCTLGRMQRKCTTPKVCNLSFEYDFILV